MSLAKLDQRLKAVERAVARLKGQVAARTKPNNRWWRDEAGRFANDPVFDEIVGLGRVHRRSSRAQRR